ncbi:hypothetical protein [Pseudoxanthomonas sp.]|uniref:hypothetical protein n=1 Tax=Pseudoxanthomonas sp. TaxID=1871049 RepID=UPI0025FB4971|nr:hypothetical protein [Pseudoxanthomonas sp.]
MTDTRYASRKFMLAAFLQLAALGLLIAGLIDAPVWKDFSVTVLMLYMAGNVGAAFVEKKVV